MSLSFFALAALQVLPPTTPDPDLWVTDGPVRSLAYDAGVLYVGGDFGWIGPPTGGFAVLDERSGAVRTGLPRAQGQVHDVEPDGQGGWFLAGDFYTVDDSGCRYLAHIRADGTLDDWCADVDEPVWSIALLDGRLFLGGEFHHVGGQERQRIAAVDAATGQLLAWDPAGTATMESSEQIYSVEAADGLVVFAGDFQATLIAGVQRRHVAAVDAVSGALHPFDPGPDGYVWDVHVAGDRVYLGGSFSLVGGLPRNNLAEVALATGIPTALDVATDAIVYDSERAGDTLYLAGHFQQVAGVPRAYLAALDLNTGAGARLGAGARGRERRRPGRLGSGRGWGRGLRRRLLRDGQRPAPGPRGQARRVLRRDAALDRGRRRPRLDQRLVRRTGGGDGGDRR